MDRELKELYVEGRHDRAFVDFLISGRRGKHVQVVQIDEVEVDARLRSNSRSAVLWLADQLGGYDVQTACFVDADFDRLEDKRPPKRTWYTDGRDLEGYLMREDCIEKYLRLALKDIETPAQVFMDEVTRVCFKVALFRIMDRRIKLGLAFKKTDLCRYLNETKRPVDFDERGYVRALFQNAGASLSGAEDFRVKAGQLECEVVAMGVKQVIHGKDFFDVVEVLSRRRRRHERGVVAALWTTFERGMVRQYALLSAVCDYLSDVEEGV